jgi:nitrogen regulatory protein P-II 1
MKMIWAIVRWTCLKDVEKALFGIGEKNFTVTKVKGLGEEREYLEYDLVSHLKIEIIVPDERVQRIKEAIAKAAWTGGRGDGLIAVLPVQEFAKIRQIKRADPSRRNREAVSK